jgi:hypothetical protein
MAMKSTPIAHLPNAQIGPMRPDVDPQQQQDIRDFASPPPPPPPQLSDGTDDDALVKNILSQMNAHPPLEDAGMLRADPQAPPTQGGYVVDGKPPSSVACPARWVACHHILKEEVKLIGVVFTVIVGVHLLPISSYLGKYVNIDRLPYGEVVVRSIVGALLVVIIKRVFFG